MPKRTKPPARKAIDREQLILANLNLVYKIAHQLRRDKNVRRIGELEDVIAVGMVGLVRAASLWDPRHESGAKFSTYAYSSIRRCIMQATETASVIRVPLTALHSDAETAGEETQRNVKRAINVAPMSGLFDVAEDTPSAEDLVEWQELRDEVDALPSPYRECVSCLYGLAGLSAMTLSETAKRLGLTPRAVKNYHDEALVMLRDTYG